MFEVFLSTRRRDKMPTSGMCRRGGLELGTCSRLVLDGILRSAFFIGVLGAPLCGGARDEDFQWPHAAILSCRQTSPLCARTGVLHVQFTMVGLDSAVGHDYRIAVRASLFSSTEQHQEVPPRDLSAEEISSGLFSVALSWSNSHEMRAGDRLDINIDVLFKAGAGRHPSQFTPFGTRRWILALQVQERPDEASAVFEEAGGAGEGEEERICEEHLLQLRRHVFTATTREAFRAVDSDMSGHISFGEMMRAFGISSGEADAKGERAGDGPSSGGLSKWRRANKEQLQKAASASSAEFAKAALSEETAVPSFGEDVAEPFRCDEPPDLESALALAATAPHATVSSPVPTSSAAPSADAFTQVLVIVVE